MGTASGVRSRRPPGAGLVPGYRDLVVLACLVCGGLVASVWLVGTRATHGPYSAAVLVGGLLGSASAALVSIGRPTRRGPGGQPLPGARWLWRVAALSGPAAALTVSTLLANSGFGNALPPAQHDRLLVGFAAGAAAWRLLQPSTLVVVTGSVHDEIA